ncbi:oleosin 18.2 kDa-like [Humulus lupulus]|uniref:oleosin 18.2 kDa-like n=1 Tax=Humulus lupulus TaxID=3486 RepID=UPI002B414144|nr:oleosin 18.2 kDa-like [Humulus lupulus]
MADRSQPHHQLQVHPQYGGGAKGFQQHRQQQGPSTGKVLAVMALLPVGGTLLALAGLTLMGTVIGLLVSIPVFLLFSPVLVPAAVTIGLAVGGFLTSGAFGVTGLSSLSWVLNFFRQTSVPEQMDLAKRRVQDAAAYAGQKTKDVGQEIQSKAQEGKRT